MAQKNLFILSNGRAAAINRNDGQVIWEVKLSQYVRTKCVLKIGQIAIEGDKLLLGGSGILLCLSQWDGSLTWKNELKGWGYQFVSLTNTNSETSLAPKSKAFKNNSAFFIFSNGRVAAINKNDGVIIWEVKLRQHLSTAVTINIGQIAMEEDRVFVGGSGVLLCLDAKDGSLFWKNELKGWGYQFISMADVSNEAAGAAMMSAAGAAAANVAVVSS